MRGGGMIKKAARGRLRLHRETLRTLGGRELARVAGGTEVFTTDLVDDLDPPYGAAPRTNAWTALDVAVVCGGGGGAG